MMDNTLDLIYGNTRIVTNVLIGTGQKVENRCFATIGVTSNRNAQGQNLSTNTNTLFSF